jgi:hypothetical protein
MSCIRIFQGTRLSAKFPIEERNEPTSHGDLLNDVVEGV